MSLWEVIACCLVSGLVFGWPATWLVRAWRARRLRARQQPFQGGILSNWTVREKP